MKSFLSKIGGKRFLVIGDLFQDIYLYGKAERISPEAPVPIIKVDNQKKVLGGAGNVASNLRELGCIVDLVSLVGQDNNGAELCGLLEEREIGTSGIISSSYPTITKTRIVSNDQHVIRYDIEEDFNSDLLSQTRLYEYICRMSSDYYDCVMLIDYSKGVLTHKLVSLAKCRFGDSIITADVKPEHFRWYNQIFAIAPNLKEAKMMSGLEDPNGVVRELKNQLELKTAIVTLSEKGVVISDEEEDIFHFPAYELITKERYHRMDVAGAGDTFLSVYTACICSGIPSSTSAYIANVAAAIVVNKLGTATCSVDELLKELENVSTEVVTEFCRPDRSIDNSSVEGSSAPAA